MGLVFDRSSPVHPVSESRGGGYPEYDKGQTNERKSLCLIQDDISAQHSTHKRQSGRIQVAGQGTRLKPGWKQAGYVGRLEPRHLPECCWLLKSWAGVLLLGAGHRRQHPRPELDNWDMQLSLVAGTLGLARLWQR